MNTHAFLNVNLMLKYIDDDNIEGLKVHLEAYLTKHNRKFVFNDKEVLEMLSHMLKQISGHEKDELSDKFTGALWHESRHILETHKII